MAQAPELSQMNIAHPRGPQLFRQGRPVELRVVSRSRDTAYVDDALDAVRPQKIAEVFPCAVRMPNGQDSMLLLELADFSRRLPARHNIPPLNTRVSAGTSSPFPMSEPYWSMNGTQKKITAKRTNNPTHVAAKRTFLLMSRQTPAIT